ncbi:thioredoxin domain-containing protein [Streptomyces sp. 21So2-11]|uniref:DsbA family protein n=1 Tax=Streptomyces sp. 21So2-11 TaxID=3144408 RepID=UPI00321B15EA
MNQPAHPDGTPPQAPGGATAPATPAHTTGEHGLVVPYGPLGDGVPALALYEDLRCPYCAAMERSSGATIRAFADAGRLRLEYHFATFLDGMQGGRGSRTALGALGAAVNEGQAEFKALHEALYANQPEERDDAYGDPANLLAVARSVPAGTGGGGLGSDGFRQAVQDGGYLPWASAVAEAFERSGIRGTPALRLGEHDVHAFSREGKPLSGREVAPQIEAALSGRATG